MKSPSRPHGFALWICLVDLPCASNLPSLPTCPPCPMYPSCAQSVPALNVSRLLRADGQEFAADAGHDTHSDESCPDRHADARHTGAGESRSQTRASNEARNDGPLRQRARELRHRVLGDVHAVVLPAPVCSICSCRGGDRPPALRSLRLLPCVAFGEIEPKGLSS